MNAIPHMDFPTLELLEQYKDTVPRYDEMIDIIQSETEQGNIVVHIGDAGGMPQETIVVVDFAYEPKCTYEKLKISRTISNHPYYYLSLYDKKGDTRLDFGAWKYRMKKELEEEIQRCLDSKP